MLAFQHNNGHDTPIQPQATGTATDPYVPFVNPVHLTLGPTTFRFANRFNAIHMALIPKGPNRGKVLVWNDFPVVFRCSNFGAGNFWSYQSYAILDPAVDSPPSGNRFQNFLLPIGQANTSPPSGDDLFCAGLCWTSFGDLFVPGGTSFSLTGQASGQATYVFNPEIRTAPFPNSPVSGSLYPVSLLGLWAAGPSLMVPRYYPTAILTHQLARTNLETLLVLGGGTLSASGLPPQSWNNYEAMQLIASPSINTLANQITPGIIRDTFNGVSVFTGPGASVNPDDDWLEIYPRTHLLTNGKVFSAGFAPLAAHVDHESTIWNQPGNIGHLWPSPDSESTWRQVRYYGATVRYPNTDGYCNRIVRMGGHWLSPNTGLLEATATVESCDADELGALWKDLPSMNHARTWLNVVLAPDASLIALGGADVTGAPDDPENDYPGASPIFEPEVLAPGASSWVDLAPAQTVRDYHSTAILLPDGRILTAGGNKRDNLGGVDYEIFEPSYVPASPENRPQNVHILGQTPAGDAPYEIHYANLMPQFTLKCDALPLGVVLDRAVLMAPGATTHHNDMSQRYHQLVVAPEQNGLTCTPPASDVVLPRGYYMLFVRTNTGWISTAIWIKLS